MKSELSFLMDLFLNEELPAPIKKLVSTRIREVEKELTQPTLSRGTIATTGYLKIPESSMVATSSVVTSQSPSMQRIMERHPDLVPANLPPVPATPAAAAALAARANLVRGAANEKPEPGRNGPRKF